MVLGELHPVRVKKLQEKIVLSNRQLQFAGIAAGEGGRSDADQLEGQIQYHSCLTRAEELKKLGLGSDASPSSVPQIDEKT